MNNKEYSQLMMDAHENPEKASFVQQALALLSHEQRSCLLLQADANFSEEEIADILELDTEKVETLLQTAHHQFWEYYSYYKHIDEQQKVGEQTRRQDILPEASQPPADVSFGQTHMKKSAPFIGYRHEEVKIPLHEISIPDLLPGLPEQILLLWEIQSKVDYLQDRVARQTASEQPSSPKGRVDLVHESPSFHPSYENQKRALSIEEQLQCFKDLLSKRLDNDLKNNKKLYESAFEYEWSPNKQNDCDMSTLDFDDIVQNIRIRLWVDPLTEEIAHSMDTLICQEIQKEYYTPRLIHSLLGAGGRLLSITGTGGSGKSLIFGALLTSVKRASPRYSDHVPLPFLMEEVHDPQQAFEQKIEAKDRLDQLVYALLSLPPVQRTAMVCLLRENLEDFASLATVFKKYDVDVSGITWPEDQAAKQQLQAACKPAQLQLARLMDINLSRYMPRRRQYIGSYLFAREIASSSFDLVYLARPFSQKNSSVTVKVFMAGLSSAGEQHSFLRAVQQLKRLKHPHILPVIDGDIEGETPYLVTEYASQGSLRQRLLRHARQPFSFTQALPIILQIGQAAYTAHQQNVIHKNIKPENILFNERGEAVLTDFEIAASLYETEDNLEIQHAKVHDTVSYMAPEQLQGRATKSSDLYALACVAYELLTGYRPFVADDFSTMVSMLLHQQPLSPKQLNPQLSSSVEHVLLKALSKQEKKRYADIQSFLFALQMPSPPELRVFNTRSQRVTKILEEWMTAGAKYYQIQRFEEAQKIYEQVIYLNPSYAPGYCGQGKVLMEFQQYQEALAVYEKALELDVTIAEAHQKKGDILSLLDDYTSALVAYDKALQLDPFLTDAYSGRGDAYCELKDYEKALEAYEQAILLCPTQTVFYKKKSNVLELLDRHTEALQVKRKARQLGYRQRRAL